MKTFKENNKKKKKIIKRVFIIINLEIENEIIKCPKCFSENINENGVKNVCEHLIFVGTSASMMNQN